MSAKTKAAVGERLPYLLGQLKAPRVLERLEQTAARARDEQWPYEQFLEALLEAEVFAREASGARQRIGHAAFPAHKTLEDFDFTAQPGAEKPVILHLAQLAWIPEHSNVCFFGRHRQGPGQLARLHGRIPARQQTRRRNRIPAHRAERRFQRSAPPPGGVSARAGITNQGR